MPGFVIGSSASRVGEAWIGAPEAPASITVFPTARGSTLSTPPLAVGRTQKPTLHPSGTTIPSLKVAFVYKPVALGPAASALAPAIKRTLKPALWPNVPTLPSPSLPLVLKPAPYANAPAYFAQALKRTLKPIAFANGPVFHGPQLTLRIGPAAYANAGQTYTASVQLAPIVKAAPHRASTAQIFGPSLQRPAINSVTVTLNLPGWTPRAPKAPPRKPAATWPNLPRVEAPPWRLTVVTPELARARMAASKRAETNRRKRKADERAGAILQTLVDEEVVRTVVNVLAEAS